MPDLIWSLLQYSGLILAVIVAAGGAAWLFLRRYGEKLIDSRFEREMATFKHSLEADLQTGIERQKAEINKDFHRSSKLYETEFEILPTAWHLLTVAYSDAILMTNKMSSYPDVGGMDDSQFQEFIASSWLRPWQAVRLAKSDDKNKLYMEYATVHQIVMARKACGELTNFLLDKGIFIELPILDLMKRARSDIDDAVLEHELDQQHPVHGPERFKRSDYMRQNSAEIMNNAEAMVRSRLWIYEKAR